MRRLKRNRQKVGLALAGMPLLLVLVVWLPVSAADAYEEALGSATPGAIVVQATPTEDATVTILNKEKLEQQVQQLKEQNEPDLFEWFRTNGAILLSTLVVVIGGLIGFFRWLGDRRSEREKRAEERFQSAVTGLGNKKEEAKIGAAILLRTFLRPGYEQFYTQTFDLAVAHLRLPRASSPPENPNTPLPLTTLSQALIVVFKEAFPLARELVRSQNGRDPFQSLDATSIQLDSSFLESADLKKAWMSNASLRSANLWGADLSESILWKANLSGAKLRGTNLSGADLWGANLNGAELKGANLNRTEFVGADLSGANLSKTNLEEAKSLKGTNLRGVHGLTKEQLEACKAKGAIIDEDSSVNSSQSTISPLHPSQDKSAQDQAVTLDQESMPTTDTGGSSAESSKRSSES